MMYRHHSVLGRAISFISLLLLSLTAIAVGLLALNIDVLNSAFVQAHFSSLIRPLFIVIGVAGLLGLFFTLFGCATGACPCNCDHTRDGRKHHHD